MNLDLTVDISVGGQAFKGSIKDVLHINEATLTDEFIKQPSLYAWFAAVAEIANAELESKKLKLSVLQSNLDAEVRSELAKTNEKATESKISSIVHCDKRVVVLNEEIIESARQLGILKAMVRSLEQRCTMLVQIGGMKRQEISLGDFGINYKKVKENNS